ncbi:MAG: CoA transferase [Dehalococcoidia bacterium]|nr:CoA transferase [Dehalococcoidia bacterium]
MVQALPPGAEEAEATLLGDIRVLDLADAKGIYCTKLLADLGADVIKVECPGGDPLRNLPPFYHDEPHPERSLYWFHFNTNKRGITLDLERAGGRALFRRLAERADVLVESYPPGHLASLGLDHASLSRLNPRLIVTSITGFGQWGHYKDFKVADITSLAMSGVMTLAGMPEDPPNSFWGSQAYHMGSVQATIGVLMALYERELSGLGQHVDVSLQEAASVTQETAMMHFDIKGHIRRRAGGRRSFPANGVYECADGHVFLSLIAGHGATWDDLLAWMAGEGKVGDLLEPQWQEVIAVVNDFRSLMALTVDAQQLNERLRVFQHIDSLVEAFLRSYTKKELYDAAQGRRIMLVPLSSPADLLASEQLAALSFFHQVTHAELGATLVYPGGPYNFSATPWRLRRRAPLIGEHNDEIYRRELGLSPPELQLLKAAGAI